jgi:Cu(I)/Ag(I) efflux system periplasmic protein CusF
MNKYMSSAPMLLALLALLAGCSPSTQQAEEAAGQSAMSDPQLLPEATVRSGSTTGVIESIDPDSRTVTIAHEPVASLEWPAMTMTFKAPEADLSALRAGDRINFDFTASGMDATITRLEPVR